jgi:hypothetical protein
LFIFIIIKGYAYCEERENNKLFNKERSRQFRLSLEEMGFLAATKMKELLELYKKLSDMIKS